jgi:hypothetical protein
MDGLPRMGMGDLCRICFGHSLMRFQQRFNHWRCPSGLAAECMAVYRQLS